MKVCLAGAFGNFGKEIFKKLIEAGHEVIACDMVEKPFEGIKNYTF